MARIASATIAATGFNEPALRRAAGNPALVATEAADYLVARGIPFRDAHEIIGRVIREAEREGKTLRDFPLERLQAISPAFGADFAEALTTEASLARRRVPGGTSPESVRRALNEIQQRLGRW
jgi:argininosuccinate lyase